MNLANGLLGLGGLGAINAQSNVPGLLGKYYNTSELNKAKTKQGLLQAGIALLSQQPRVGAPIGIGESFGAALRGGMEGAQQAQQDYMNNAMQAYQMDRQAQDDAWQQKTRDRQLKAWDSEDQRKAAYDHFIKALPEDQKALAEQFPEQFGPWYVQKAFPQPKTRLITGQEAVKMGLPPGAYNMDSEGKISQIGGGGVNISLADEVSQRKSVAEGLGITPDNPAYNTFVATGKMPREDQSPLTATDKKAILEADDMVAANEQAISVLEGVLAPGIDGKSLNDKAGYGVTAGTQSWLAQNDPTGGYLFDQEQGNATAELDNAVISGALANLKVIFGGNPTEGERKILLDMQGSSSKSPEVRKAIYLRAIEAARKRLVFNRQRADGLRGQNYYKPGGAPKSTNIGGWTIQEVPQGQ